MSGQDLGEKHSYLPTSIFHIWIANFSDSTGCCFLSPFQLSMLRISPSMGHSLDMNMSLRHLLFLLEYCMVTGYDWWDILLHVQPGMVQNLVEKLHEEYMRQNAALQQVRGKFKFYPWRSLNFINNAILTCTGTGRPALHPLQVWGFLWLIWGKGKYFPLPWEELQ